MKTSYLKPFVLLVFVALLASCSSDEKPTVETTPPPAAEPQEMSEEDLAKADKMIKQMPSPIEMAILIKHAGGEYNAGLLNDVKRVENYATNGKKTMNLGVYSADVGYTSLYKQTQETMFYLNNVRMLSDDIGLTEAFDPAVFDRVESNIENRDSLLHILSSAYDVANGYLKDNDRMNTSLLMIAGGWIESMYLAANLGFEGTRPEDVIALRVLEQEVVLNKIISTMKLTRNDPLIAEFTEKLEGLSEVLIDADIRIGEGDEATVDEEKIEVAYKKIDAIRDWVVQ